MNITQLLDTVEFNPFDYFRGDDDVVDFCKRLAATAGCSRREEEEALRLLLTAVFGFVYRFGAEPEKNPGMVERLVRLGCPEDEEDFTARSTHLDLMFKQVAEGVYYDRETCTWVADPMLVPQPDDFSVCQYKKFKQATIQLFFAGLSFDALQYGQ